MASWTMSPGLIVSFRLLEMLFIGAQRPEEEEEDGQEETVSDRKKKRNTKSGMRSIKENVNSEKKERGF